MMMRPRIADRAAAQAVPDALVLLQMGGPSRLRDIRGFLVRLFSDPEIIRFPARLAAIQPLFAHTIAALRTPLLLPRYHAMGGGSPLNRITHDQADALCARTGLPVLVAYRYASPDAQAVCRRLRQVGAKDVLIVPLYPHWSHTTTGSSLRDLARARDATGLNVDLQVVPSWGEEAAYVDLIATSCRRALESFRSGMDEPVHLVFSAHSLPRRYTEDGDPYQNQVEATFARVKAELDDSFASVRLGYQSRVGPVKWIGPETDTVLEEMAAEGVRAVLVSPFGFVSDHIETRFDLDRKYRMQARKLGIDHYERVASFNDDPDFIRLLEHLVKAAPRHPLDALVGRETARE